MAGKLERKHLDKPDETRACSRMERESLMSSQSAFTLCPGRIRARLALVATR